jgi:hypothetical protein
MSRRKPLALAREDFSVNLINLVNESGLPIFVVKDVITLLLEEVTKSAMKELEKSRQEYESQDETDEKEGENNE